MTPLLRRGAVAFGEVTAGRAGATTDERRASSSLTYRGRVRAFVLPPTAEPVLAVV
jgi:hypothetical protein